MQFWPKKGVVNHKSVENKTTIWRWIGMLSTLTRSNLETGFLVPRRIILWPIFLPRSVPSSQPWPKIPSGSFLQNHWNQNKVESSTIFMSTDIDLCIHALYQEYMGLCTLDCIKSPSRGGLWTLWSFDLDCMHSIFHLPGRAWDTWPPEEVDCFVPGNQGVVNKPYSFLGLLSLILSLQSLNQWY